MAAGLRAGEDRDARALAEVCTRCWHVSYAGIVPPEGLAEITVEGNMARWHDYRRHGECQTLVAEDGGDLAGYITFGPSRDEGAPVGVGEVYALMVDPPAQGRGVGRALLAAAMDGLAGRGFALATLWVLEAYPPARALYRACGWTEDGTREVLLLGGAELPKLRMEWVPGAS